MFDIKIIVKEWHHAFGIIRYFRPKHIQKKLHHLTPFQPLLQGFEVVPLFGRYADPK